MPLNDREEACLLLDYYGSLLTQHQKSVLEDYYNEDLSMAEIAENLQISKSAVSDLIKRSLDQMKTYEDHLNLLSQADRLNGFVQELRKKGLKQEADQLLQIIRG